MKKKSVTMIRRPTMLGIPSLITLFLYLAAFYSAFAIGEQREASKLKKMSPKDMTAAINAATTKTGGFWAGGANWFLPEAIILGIAILVMIWDSGLIPLGGMMGGGGYGGGGYQQGGYQQQGW